MWIFSCEDKNCPFQLKKFAFWNVICILGEFFVVEEEKTYCSDQEALYIVKYFYLTNKLMIHCELPIPCLCSEEKHLIVPGHRPDGPELMVMMTCIGHMAFWACNTHWTPLFQAKTAPHFWERLTGRRLAICAHFLLQPIDLLTDLKINSKLIYSALYRVIY